MEYGNQKSGATRRARTLAGRYVRPALAVVAGVVVGLVLTRVAVETLVYHPTGRVAHPTLGPIYRPGIDVHGMEGFAWSRIGEEGMRVPLFGSARGAEAAIATRDTSERPLRVLCVGDSYTEGFQVPYSATFPARLEERLADTLRRPVAGINAGMSGGSPAKYIATAAHLTQRFRPDAVVVQLNDGDFTEMSRNKAFFYAERTATGYRVLPGAWSRDPQRVSASKLDTIDERLMGDAVNWVTDDIRAKRKAAGKPQSPQGRRRNAPVKLTPEQIAPVAWTVRSLAEGYDAPVIVVYMPQVYYPDISPSPDPIESALASACAANGVDFLSARSGFAERFARDGTPSHGFANTRPGTGHINSVGHDIVASQLSERLAPLLALVPTAGAPSSEEASP